MERTLDGAVTKAVNIANQMLTLAGDLPLPLRRELETVIHKITYPMKEILAKVPGTSLTERAKKLHVSRQTMYVWMSEKFRPTKLQAKRISKVTGVPLEHIVDDGFEVNNGARRKARKKVTRVATARKKTTKSKGGTTPKRRRSVTDRHRIGEA